MINIFAKKTMQPKRLLQEYFQDTFFRTLFIIAAILGFLLLFMSVADQLNLLGQNIGSAIYRILH